MPVEKNKFVLIFVRFFSILLFIPYAIPGILLLFLLLISYKFFSIIEQIFPCFKKTKKRMIKVLLLKVGKIGEIISEYIKQINRDIYNKKESTEISFEYLTDKVLYAQSLNELSYSEKEELLKFLSRSEENKNILNSEIRIYNSKIFSYICFCIYLFYLSVFTISAIIISKIIMIDFFIVCLLIGWVISSPCFFLSFTGRFQWRYFYGLFYLPIASIIIFYLVAWIVFI